MRHVNYTNIYRALRRSYDSGDYERINDDWVAYFDAWDRAVLWNDTNDEGIRTGSIYGCTSMTDLLRFATGLLLEEFKGKPWLDLGEREREAFSSATSFHRCGCSPRSDWDALFDDLDEATRNDVWKMAFWYVAEGCVPWDWRTAA